MHQQHRYLMAPPLPDCNSTTAPVADYRSPRKTEARHNRAVQRRLRRLRRVRHLAELGLVAARLWQRGQLARLSLSGSTASAGISSAMAPQRSHAQKPSRRAVARVACATERGVGRSGDAVFIS